MRRSRPYTEFIDGLPEVMAGDQVERDDGWWRAVEVRISSIGNRYQSEVLWRPEPKLRPPETDLSRITWFTEGRWS